ncbi:MULTISPECIES: hypothetical protein [Olivibacter]|uniref:Uncharacterized protein n=1 Tax=Olivibacter jilunii TaxID=985016 RepID=A0ABW6AVZ1_9SPHI
MNHYFGSIEFYYHKRLMIVPYSFNMLAGNPRFYLKDKLGNHHAFFKGQIWEYSSISDRPKRWTKEFTEALYNEFDKEIRYIYYKYKVLGLNKYLSNDLCEEQ